MLWLRSRLRVPSHWPDLTGASRSAASAQAGGGFFYTLLTRVCCTQSCTPHRCLETALAISTREVVPLSQARATLSELADQVQAGAEKMITQNGESDVVIAIRRNNSVCP